MARGDKGHGLMHALSWGQTSTFQEACSRAASLYLLDLCSSARALLFAQLPGRSAQKLKCTMSDLVTGASFSRFLHNVLPSEGRLVLRQLFHRLSLPPASRVRLLYHSPVKRSFPICFRSWYNAQQVSPGRNARCKWWADDLAGGRAVTKYPGADVFTKTRSFTWNGSRRSVPGMAICRARCPAALAKAVARTGAKRFYVHQARGDQCHSPGRARDRRHLDGQRQDPDL